MRSGLIHEETTKVDERSEPRTCSGVICQRIGSDTCTWRAYVDNGSGSWHGAPIGRHRCCRSAPDLDTGRASTSPVDVGCTSGPQPLSGRSIPLSVHGLRRYAGPGGLSWPRHATIGMTARCASRGAYRGEIYMHDYQTHRRGCGWRTTSSSTITKQVHQSLAYRPHKCINRKESNLP